MKDRVFAAALILLLGTALIVFNAVRDPETVRDPWPLMHKHPPRDAVSNAQTLATLPKPTVQEQASLDASTADDCEARFGVPYWREDPAGRQYLTCEAGNVVGVTHGNP